MAAPTGTAQGAVPVQVITHTREHLTEGFRVFHNNEPTHASSLTHSIADRQLPIGMVSVCKQVLQVAEWEGSAALVHTHCDPALWVGKTQ